MEYTIFGRTNIFIYRLKYLRTIFHLKSVWVLIIEAKSNQTNIRQDKTFLLSAEKWVEEIPASSTNEKKSFDS